MVITTGNRAVRYPQRPPQCRFPPHQLWQPVPHAFGTVWLTYNEEKLWETLHYVKINALIYVVLHNVT